MSKSPAIVHGLFEKLNRLRRKLSRQLIRALGGVTRDEMRDSLAQVLAEIRVLQDRTIHLTHCYNETVAWAASSHQSVDDSNWQSHAEEPLVSIIMPVLNRETVIETAIASVIAQSWQNWELLIVDDGSTDQTKVSVQKFTNDSRVHWLPRDHHGVSAARNHGLAQTQGEFVAYLDSDNHWYPTHLSTVVWSLCRKPHFRCAYASQHVHDVSRNMNYIRGRNFDRDYFSEFGGIDLNTFVHRIELYQEQGGFDENLTRLVDWDLISRYVQNASPLFVSDVTNFYIESRSDSITVNEDFLPNADIVKEKMNKATDLSVSTISNRNAERLEERKAS